jgi:hypothetical protein
MFIILKPWVYESARKTCSASRRPSLGDIRSIEELRAYAAKAKRLPARDAVFRSLYLNRRSTTTIF